MLMALRVAYLWTWLVVGTLALCYALMTADGLIEFAGRSLGDDAPGAARHGQPILYLSAVARHLADSAWLLPAGAGMGLLCRLIDAARSWRQRGAERRVSTIVDRFGIRLTMFQAPLEHHPDVRDLKISPLDGARLPAGLSPIERDALGLLAAHPDVPADVEGHHGVSLATHSYRAWTLACKRHGIGSLEAQVALCHDLGKIRAYAKDESGQWVRRALHRSLTLQIVRDFDGYLETDEQARTALMEALTALLTNCVPVDLSERARAIVRSAKHVDFKATAEEKRSQDEVRIDPQALADLLRGSIVSLLAELNINRKRDAAAPVEGFYVAETAALLIPEPALRARIAQALPGEMADAFRRDPGAERKASPVRDLVVRAVQLLFDTYSVYADKPAKDGTFHIKSRIRAYEHVIAINTTSFPATLTQSWGRWNYEVDIV